MFHHRLWYRKWSWGHLLLVVWVPCRQKHDAPSGCRSAVLAQISQKCISCSNCRPKCVKRSLNGPIWQSYHLTNIVDSLPIICKDRLMKFCCFPVLCLLTVVQNAHHHWQTFVCPWSVCTIKKFCFGSWHYLWRLPVAFGGFLQQVFVRLKQNLMQILCSSKSIISVAKKNRQITNMYPHKNTLNLITHPLSLTTVGTLIHKAYC